MAYLKASEKVNPTAQKMYLEKVNAVLFLQVFKGINESRADEKRNKIESILKRETEKGDNFYSQIRQNEMAWIASGKNPETEYSKTYYKKSGTNTRVKDLTALFYQDSTASSPETDSVMAISANDPEMENIVDSILDSIVGDSAENTVENTRMETDPENNQYSVLWWIFSGVVILGIGTYFLWKYRKQKR